jgi:hypothetical protein
VRSVVATLWVLLGVVPAVHARPAVGVTVEVGPELDTNATRIPLHQDQEPVLSGLARIVGEGSLKLQHKRHLFLLDVGAGTKLFWSEAARGANEVVYHGDLSWAAKLGGGTLLLGGNLYDVLQRESLRDFRSEGGTVHYFVDGPLRRLRPSLFLGYRGLQYKPDDRYSFHGPLGGAAIQWSLTSGRGDAMTDWMLRLQYTASGRFFSGDVTALPARCTGLDVLCTDDQTREDLNHQFRVEVSYLGNADAKLWYSAEVNRSNSYGETFQRHALGLKFTTALIWGLFLTAKGVLQLSRFRDPYVVSEVSNLSFVSIDDENRSSLLVQLARDIVEHWTINLRYGLYVSEATAQESTSQVTVTGDFLRHTLFLGVRFEYGR